MRRLRRFVWPLKRHSSAKFGNARLRPPPVGLARLSALVLRTGHQSPGVLKGQTPDDQKRLIRHQKSPQERGSGEDLTFFKAVVILLTAPFEGLLHLEWAGSLLDLRRRGPVKASLPFYRIL